MTDPAPGTARIDDCWNRIGINGDRLCPELPRYIRCQNCPVYTAAARRLLDRAVAPDYRASWARQFSSPAPSAATLLHTCLLFRVHGEWLALPGRVVQEVAELRTVRSLPHRRSDAVLGLINLRGQLLVLVSLARLLEITPGAVPAGTLHFPRLLVVGSPDRRIALTVDEVSGIRRYTNAERSEVPGTLHHAQAARCSAMIRFGDCAAGLLDPERLLPELDQVVT